MRRSTLALSSSLAAIGLSASIALAQQSSRGPTFGVSAPARAPEPASADESIDPSMAARPTRYLLRNGLDYLNYREYARALSFFRAVEVRQGDLNEAEALQLKKGIARAQQGMREAVNGTRVVAQAKGRPGVQPGAFALAKPAEPARAAKADPVVLTSAEMPAPPAIPPVGEMPALPPAQPAPEALANPDPMPMPMPMPILAPAPAEPSAKAPATEPLPVLPEPSKPEPAPADPLAQPAQAPSVELPPMAPPSTDPPPPLVLESSVPTPTPTPAASPVELPSIPAQAPELPPTTSPPAPMPAAEGPSSLPAAPEPTPVEPRQVARRAELEAPAPRPRQVSAPAREPLPAAEAPAAPEVAPWPRPAASIPASDLTTMHESLLSPRLAREVELIAQRPANNNDSNMPGAVGEANELSAPVQGSPRLELPRAPSPTEARPLHRIPVPEEFVPLGKREWDPNRKYWAAAGTCHMILYFQDPVLERYGQGVEQSLGPIGRYFSYPLDDPKQSNQRNQILQPFYSFGKFCFQVGTLPYKLVVDPPWEAEYDLGYYRPGDRIPPDTIMITPTGVGPPLKGRQY